MMKILKSHMKNRLYKLLNSNNINRVTINKKNKTTTRRKRMQEDEEKTKVLNIMKHLFKKHLKIY